MERNSHHTPATRAAIGLGRRRGYDYERAALAARALLYAGLPSNDRLLRLAVDEALELAPPGSRHSWELLSEALAAGRRVKVMSYPTSFTTPFDPALVAEVDAIFEPE